MGSLLQRNGNLYILSNNHVLARSDLAAIGDSITQPGIVDANCSTAGTTTVANLRTTGLTCSRISAIGITASVSYQRGCNGTSSFSVTFTGQISVVFPTGSAFSGEGDSGSLIVDQNTADPVALLYAGSGTDSDGNPVADVLSALADGQGNRPSFAGSASTRKVIGCGLAAANVTNTQAQSATAIDANGLARAQRALDLHAPELLANPYVQAISVGASLDHPGEAAVLLFVNSDQIRENPRSRV